MRLRVLLPVLLQLPVERIITAAQVGVFIYTLDGIIVDQPLNNKPLSASSHLVSSVISKPGTYLVVYKENGTTSVKKVIIN